MAIEAARQMNADSAEPLELQSFTLRSVSISTALIVPDTDAGVEMIFAFHKDRSRTTPNGQSEHTYAFSVSSINVQNGTFNDHATGVVEMTKMNESKHNPSHHYRPSRLTADRPST